MYVRMRRTEQPEQPWTRNNTARKKFGGILGKQKPEKTGNGTRKVKSHQAFLPESSKV